MKNQFFYTRKEPIQPKEEDKDKPLEFKKYTDSINIEKIIRSVEMEDGKLLILLDDIHQRTIPVPIYNKRKEITGYKNQTSTYQTEVYLEKEDVNRFMIALGEKIDYELC